VLARWLVAVLLLAGTFAACSVAAQGKPTSLDAAITTRVESVLAKHRHLGSMDIKVETHDSVVSLTGFVRSVADIADAGDLTRAVDGVSGVRNGLRVADQPSRA